MEAGGAPPDQDNLKPTLRGAGGAGGHGGHGGRGPHLEPSSLPFLSNSVETLRCVRQDRENRTDEGWTFLLHVSGFRQKMRQRRETATQNETTQKEQEGTDRLLGRRHGEAGGWSRWNDGLVSVRTELRGTDRP